VTPNRHSYAERIVDIAGSNPLWPARHGGQSEPNRLITQFFFGVPVKGYIKKGKDDERKMGRRKK
jgi:hypothetical protein